jgi:hypothetical protein
MQVSHSNGIDGRSGGRFGAATPGMSSERAAIGDLVAMRGSAPAARRRRVITPWRTVALIAAIIVAGSSYALGRYVIAPKPPQEVQIAVTRVQLRAGAKLVQGDLRFISVRAPFSTSGALTPALANGLLGHFTNRRIRAGTFLVKGMFTTAGGMPDATHRLVGLALKPGQLPAGGLAVGQNVDILLLPVSTDLSVKDLTPKSDATIWALLPPDSSGTREVTVLVHHDLAKELANYAAHGQVALVATETP